jgi:hypothetical protein
MSKIYNRAFKIGVFTNVLIFAVLNIVSYVVSYREYSRSAINFSGNTSPDWGIPFSWFLDTTIGLGLILNVGVIAFFSFVFGFLFKFISERGRVK